MKDYTKKLLGNFSGSLVSFIENIANTGRAKKQIISILVDMALVVAALWFAYTLRLDHIFTEIIPTWYIFLLLPPLTALIFAAFGVYRWVVRSSNSRLSMHLIKGCILSAFLLVLIVYLFPPTINGHPRSLFAIYGMVITIFTIGSRLLWRRINNYDEKKFAEPVAIYGTGSKAYELAAMMSIDGKTKPVMYLDKNEALINTTIGDVPVFDVNSQHLQTQLRKYDVSRVIFSPNVESTSEIRDKTNKFVSLGVDVKIIPSITDIISGRAKEGEIRDIQIEDLLGRSVVNPDKKLMEACVVGKSVLVTGGGGSIGSELCRQIAHLGVRRLVVLDNSEHNLYQITEELNPMFSPALSNAAFVPVLGSVTDQKLVSNLMLQQQIDTVYHAAAYKHVPIIEEHPEQGTLVNVFGTLNVLEAAVECKAENFILISTDKAVNPVNAMGASKRLAELILQAKAECKTDTTMSMVRFGNVMGSSGSVIPKFKEQILRGGPVTVTDPDVTRYFMTIPEAAALVIQANAIAKGGDVFVLDMGEQLKILDIAEQMIKIYGGNLRSLTKSPKDIEIKIVGLRPGEKLSEELFQSVNVKPTSVPKIAYSIENYIPWKTLRFMLSDLGKQIEDNCLEPSELKDKLLKICKYHCVGTKSYYVVSNENDVYSSNEFTKISETVN